MSLKENLLLVDYNIRGFFKNKIQNSKGDIVTVDYYANYDGTNFTNLKVKETRTYVRNSISGLLETRTMQIDTFDADGVTVLQTKTYSKYYSAEEGFKANKRARQNLLDKASMYLFSQVGLANAKAFWKTLGSDDAKDYKAIGDLNIVTSINSSIESYMTPVIKGTLDLILNITY